MTGIVEFKARVYINYTHETLEGVHKISYPLFGRCALRLEDKGVRIEGFLFPLEIYNRKIQPYITWHKITFQTMST